MQCESKQIYKRLRGSIQIFITSFRCFSNVYSSAYSYNSPRSAITSRYFNLKISNYDIVFNLARFTLSLRDISTYNYLRGLIYINVFPYISTDDNRRRTIDLYIFPCTLRWIDINITNYMKINRTTCQLISGDISIDKH